MLDVEYGDLIVCCEVRWISRCHVLSRFWKLNNSVDNFLEEKSELHEERAVSRYNNWLFNLAFLVDVTSHLEDINLKLQGKNKTFLA